MKRGWNEQYKNPTFLSLGTEVSADVVRFYKSLKKEWRVREVETGIERYDATTLRVIDLGCGNGKNSVYLADRGAEVVGLDISPEAIAQAKKLAADTNVIVDFRVGSIGEPLPFADGQFNLALDMTVSHCLPPTERKNFISETARILEKDGRLFARLLCADGDRNVKKLLEVYPGPDKESYMLPDTGLPEWPLSKEKLMELYAQYFEIDNLQRTWHYATFNGQKHKRAYWVMEGRRK